jgi:pantothenate kinase
MVAYNIGQLAYMHAKAYDLKRVFFGGFFIRGHPYTMETISFAIKFWSQVGLLLNQIHALVEVYLFHALPRPSCMLFLDI